MRDKPLTRPDSTVKRLLLGISQHDFSASIKATRSPQKLTCKIAAPQGQDGIHYIGRRELQLATFDRAGDVPGICTLGEASKSLEYLKSDSKLSSPTKNSIFWLPTLRPACYEPFLLSALVVSSTPSKHTSNFIIDNIIRLQRPRSYQEFGLGCVSAMNTGKAPACTPTWRGHIETTKDALLIFEACFEGTLAHCFRRPHDRERNQLIVSGNVFVYEEATSGIKRWTDGIPWSPSRILTNFLIYRQLNSPFPPGEKKRATKRSQRAIKPGEPYPTSATSTPVTDESRPFPPESPNPSLKAEENPDKDANRGLVGSLVDSYEFKENGLLKKTMTVTVNHVQHHLVSYYSLEDAKHNLRTPRDDPHLKDLRIRESLLNQPKFKFPNLDDAGDGTYEQLEQHNPYQGYAFNGYDPTRMYPAMQMSQVSSPMGYQGGVYAPSHPPSTSPGYASIAPTTSGYATAVHYSQHNPLTPQHPYSHLNQPPQYQSQPTTHSPYQSQQYSGHSQDQLQHPGYPPQSATTSLPRPTGMLDYSSGAHNNSGLSHDPYSAGGIKLEGMVPTSQSQPPQAWQMPYSPQPWAGRPEGTQYSSYRTQS